MTSRAQSLLESWTTDTFPQEIYTLARQVKEQQEKHPEYEYFTQELAFGTGGVRGLMGVGCGRINLWTLGRLTHALSQYIKQLCGQRQPSVVIGYDTRYMSREFAQSTAGIFASHGIKTGLFAKECPTPLLSYAVLQQKTDLGIMITASHNPKEYNGYKVFHSNGAQIIGEVQREIETILQTLDYHNLNFVGTGESLYGKYVYELQGDIFESYLQRCFSRILPAYHPKQKKNTLVYSPLHGAGTDYMYEALQRSGSKVILVKEQTSTDGSFPTIAQPNPEEASAMQMAIECARKNQVAVFLATDPDVDRLGVGYLDTSAEQKVHLLTGNQIGSIFCAFLCDQIRNKVSEDKASLNPIKYIFCKSIVTTDLQTEIICAHEKYGCEIRNLLTGFKYIAEQMIELNPTRERFILGCEESYGYLPVDFIRDKDAISSAVLLAEILRRWGENLDQILTNIYIQYGLYLESLFSLTEPGKIGQEKIARIISDLRGKYELLLHSQLAGRKIKTILDYQQKLEYRLDESFAPHDQRANKKMIIRNLDAIGKIYHHRNLPRSNVIQLQLHPKGTLTIRPSGTEPKLKIYVELKHPQKMENSTQIREERPLLAKEMMQVSQAFFEIANIDSR